jgi:hypothetical protein
MNYGSQNYMTVGVYKTKRLARFARRERITDGSLREAVDRAERGLVDADLGGGLIKQRVARERQGRSGGYRMLVAFRQQGRAVFLYGFAKSEQENIGPDELASLREIAAAWLDADADRMKAAVEANELQEVGHGKGEA